MVRFVVALGVAILALGGTASARAADDPWVASWAAAQQGPYPKATLAPGEYAFLADQSMDQSFRMIVHLSTGGTQLRVRLSNLVGTKPITFDGLHVAHRNRYSAVDPSRDRMFTFGGQPLTTIPPGGMAVSDPVDLETHAGEDLAVSFHIPGMSGPMTFHGTSFATSYVSGAFSGDITANDDGAGFGFPILSWFFLEGIDVSGGPATTSVVAFGDSITDGFFTNVDTNTRWPDLLSRKLGPEFGVANAGIGGNSISTARNKHNDPFAGPPGVERWQHDALDQAGVRTIILLEGTNDLSIDAGAVAVQEAITDVVKRAHAEGICVIGATVTPRADGIIPYGWDAQHNEPERQKLNAWIRSPQAPFDAVADTDAALRWADHPDQLNPKYDSGDRVHLNAAGRQAIADAMPLDVIRRCAQDEPVSDCRRRQRVVVRLPAGLRRIRVHAGGRVVRAKRGARRVVVEVADRTGEQLKVRVRARRASGKRYRADRHYKLCR